MGCSKCGHGSRMTQQQMISKVGSTLPYLKFAYCAYKDQFEALFNQVGIYPNDSNLAALARFWENGGDLRGDFKNPDGTPNKFSIEVILDKIDTSKPVNNTCTVA